MTWNRRSTSSLIAPRSRKSIKVTLWTLINSRSSETKLATYCAFKKINGKWLIAHTHVSFPLDLRTGQADTESKR